MKKIRKIFESDDEGFKAALSLSKDKTVSNVVRITQLIKFNSESNDLFKINLGFPTMDLFIADDTLLPRVKELRDGLQYFVDINSIRSSSISVNETRAGTGDEIQFYVCFDFKVDSKSELSEYFDYLSQIKMLVDTIDGVEFKMGGLNIMYFIF